MSNEYYSGINNIRDSNSHFVVVVGVVAVIVFVIVETIVVLGIIVDVIVVLVFKILVTLLILMRVVISGVIVLLICWGPLLGYLYYLRGPRGGKKESAEKCSVDDVIPTTM